MLFPALTRLLEAEYIAPMRLTRRSFLSQSAATLLAKPKKDRLVIDTHLEVWTLDPRFPFRHPEHPDAKPTMDATIDDQVADMRVK